MNAFGILITATSRPSSASMMHDRRTASVATADERASVALLVSACHSCTFDLPVSLLLEKHVGFQHRLALGVGQFTPMLRLERAPEMKLLHLGLGSRKAFIAPFLQTSLE
jgi:hypothetical protein